MSPTCPECGTELEIANYELVRAEPGSGGRNWRRLALWALLALLMGLACVVVIYWR